MSKKEYVGQKKSIITTKKLVSCALLVALYVVLGYFKIPIGNILRLNVASFAVMVGAIAFGPIEGLAIGFLGEFLSQVLGPYGLTPTTVLWALPEGVRGLLLGCYMLLIMRKAPTKQLHCTEKIIPFLIVCILVGIVASMLNTAALYVDSKMYDYYTPYMVFGVLGVRLVIACVTSGLFGYIALLIISALKRNKLL